MNDNNEQFQALAFLDDRTNLDFDTMNQLKAKREKLLLARTTPVENSDEKPEPVPMPPVRKRQCTPQTATERRRQLQMSKSVSQCRVSNLANVGGTTWKSFSSLEVDGNGAPMARRKLRDRKKRKEVKFSEVQVFYFARDLGQSTVPSLEGASLGMADKHHMAKTYSFYEYSRAAFRQNEQKWSLIRKTIEEQKKLASPRRSPRRGGGILVNGNFPSRISKTHILLVDEGEAPEEIQKSVLDLTQELVEQVAETLEKEREESEKQTDESDDPDEVLPFQEAEHLQPLDKDIRRAILQSSDVKIDPEFEEDEDCKRIRASRSKCGCNCKSGVCLPGTCECSLEGIKCQIDREGFPCVCSSISCSNPEGRVEFNPLKVRSHYLSTLKILKDMEKVSYEPTTFGPKHIQFPNDDDEVPGTSTSYLPTPPPPIYTTQVTSVQKTTSGNLVQKSNQNNSNEEECASPVVGIMSGTPTEFLTPPSASTKRKYPVTPIYKRSASFGDSIEEEERSKTGLPRRSPRSPTKRASLTSIVVVGNVDSPIPKKIRSLAASPKNMATFSQTIDEENFPIKDES